MTATSAEPTPIADTYRDVAARIIAAAQADDGGWKKLAHLTDRIGARLSGSAALEQAVAWATETLRADGHENVHTEEVMVPHWVRGPESLELVKPVARPLGLLGLGGTVGTPPRGVYAEVVVADDWAALAALGDTVKGKIVLFNRPLPPFDPVKGSGYDKTVEYRTAGASRAAQQGAVAVLVRSVTAHSLRTPHTGALRYADGVPKIPAAAVTVEDAEYLARLVASGDPVFVRLKLGARTLPDAKSHNVVAELRGREAPDEIVLIGGHLDSWDVGQGAHDDGTGCAMAMQSLTLLRQLKLQPRRTIRVVLFTNEENGLRGGRKYIEQHRDELAKHVAAIESDAGGFKPLGYSVQVPPDHPALAQLRDILSLVARLDVHTIQSGFSGADIMGMASDGVILLGHEVENSHYFDYHHTQADTLDKVDPQDFRDNVAVMAVMAYVIADMPQRLGATK